MTSPLICAGQQQIVDERLHAVPDDVAVLWSSEQTCSVGEPRCPGTWFGIHVPVSTGVDPVCRERFLIP